MVSHVDMVKDLEWTRRREILTGVEAIVFAAAGFLFGSQVQRVANGARVDAAKEKAAEARSQARREELKSQRERAIADEAQRRKERAEREAGQLAAAFRTAQEATGPRAAGGIPRRGLRPDEPIPEGLAGQADHPLEGLATLRDLAQNVLNRDGRAA